MRLRGQQRHVGKHGKTGRRAPWPYVVGQTVGAAARDCAAIRQRMLDFAMHDVSSFYEEKALNARGCTLRTCNSGQIGEFLKQAKPMKIAKTICHQYVSFVYS
jgi:hypothetical protein